MKAITCLLCFPAVLVAMAGCRESPVKGKLDELDDVLARREIYIQTFEREVDSLRRELGNAADASSRWRLAYAMYSKYRFYQVDSCAKYLDMMAESRHAGSHENVVSALSRAEIEISLRNYQTAADILASLDSLQGEAEERASYYNVQLLLYTTQALDGSVPQQERERCQRLRHKARLQYLACPAIDPFEKTRRRAIQLYEDGHAEDAVRMLKRLLEESEGLHDKAQAAYSLSCAYGSIDDRENRMYYLAQSAIYDLMVPVREYLSLYELADMLFKDGQTARASVYGQVALQDALACNYGARIYNSAAFQLDIVKAVEDQERQKAGVTALVIFLLSLLLVAVAAFLIRSAVQSKKLAQAAVRMELMNARLEEANKIKEGYVFRYINLSAKYLGQVEEYRHRMRVTLRESGVEAIKKMLREPAGQGVNYRQFYRIFDETFLGIFPDFVDRVNSLLEEDARFRVRPGDDLPMGIRILAAIRLGISDSGKIAEFLNCAPTSVYTLRSKIKKRSLCPPEEFEERICSI